MTYDQATDTFQHDTRVMTFMFLVSAECAKTGLNMRRIVEAQSPTQAEELWKQALGYYDADPRYTFDLDEVTIHMLPEVCGYPGIIMMDHALVIWLAIIALWFLIVLPLVFIGDFS